MIKHIILIRDAMVTRLGSLGEASVCIERCFSGNGSLSLAYDLFVQKVEKWPWKHIIWKQCILPKHRFALWLLAHGKFMTRDRQSYVKEKMCVLYNVGNESVSHLFFQCPFSHGLWSTIH